LVGRSEPGGYLRPGVTLNDGEIMAPGIGHAEQDIIAYAKANNWEPVTVAAGRPICPKCVDEILGSGASTASAVR
jgi:filamentous hemagglutinin